MMSDSPLRWILLVVWLQLVSSSTPWKDAPWQTNAADNVAEQAMYNGKPPTIFSPTGRLHPVERTMELVREPRSNLVVAMHCQDGMLLLSTVPLSPYLNTTVTPLGSGNNDTSTNTSMSSSLFLISNEVEEGQEESSSSSSSILPIVDLSPGAMGVTAGNPLPSQVLRMRLQALAQSMMEHDLDDRSEPRGDSLSVSQLARNLADQLQVPTQKTTSGNGLPLLASAAVVMGQDELWRIDPTGQFWNCHAAVVGRQSDKAEEALLTKLLDRMGATNDSTDMGAYLKTLKCDDALELICGCLQSVFWPKPINLKGLPQGVRAAIPSIPWVAVSLQEHAKVPVRRIRRGAFLPPIVTGEEDEEAATSNDEAPQ